MALTASVALLSVAGACSDDEPTVTPPPPVEEAGIVDATTSGGDAGHGFVLQVDCPVGTVPELESNDEPDAANELGPSDLAFCGSISPGTDVDYSRFTTPEGKKLSLFQAVVEGAVDFDLIVNDKTLKPTDVKRFEAGGYLIKAFTLDGGPGKYRYRIQFEP